MNLFRYRVFSANAVAAWLLLFALLTLPASLALIAAPVGCSESPATRAYLIPFLAILAASFVSKAAAGYFEWLYPLRFVSTVKSPLMTRIGKKSSRGSLAS